MSAVLLLRTYHHSPLMFIKHAEVPAQGMLWPTIPWMSTEGNRNNLEPVVQK
jgi:hypothetical protein